MNLDNHELDEIVKEANTLKSKSETPFKDVTVLKGEKNKTKRKRMAETVLAKTTLTDTTEPQTKRKKTEIVKNAASQEWALDLKLCDAVENGSQNGVSKKKKKLMKVKLAEVQKAAKKRKTGKRGK